MPAEPHPPIETTAKIRGHPIHPMLVPLPIAFLIGAFLADLAFWSTGGEFWAVAAAWLVGAGIAGGALAALAGLADFLGNARIRAISGAWHHFIGNAAAVALAIVSLAVRVSQGPVEGALPWGLLLSFVVVAILAYTGWLGGELVFRHRVGVMPDAGHRQAP